MDKCSKCRKFGSKLFLKGERCNTPKCALTRRNYQPGDHGQKRAPRKSEYGLQLLEKQKAKAEYGLRERQFSKTFQEAAKSRQNTGEELLKLLEARFDNVIYRLGWGVSRAHSRQLILHRNFKVNGKLVNIPSTSLKPKDIIQIINKEKVKPIKVTVPKWLKSDEKALSAEVLNLPGKDQIDTGINNQLIIEFYSR